MKRHRLNYTEIFHYFYRIKRIFSIHYVINLYKFTANKLNEADKQIIVDKHNQLRKLIANGKVPGQPRGVNLKKMVSSN